MEKSRKAYRRAGWGFENCRNVRDYLQYILLEPRLDQSVNIVLVIMEGDKQVGERCTMVTEARPASSISSATSWAVFAVPIMIPCFPFQEKLFL